MITRKPFFYIRHGQTDWNVEKRFQGKKDIPLNATGEQQAFDAIDGLTGQGVTHIFSSPLQRARRTADIINDTLKLPLTEIDTLQECNFGMLEGVQRAGRKFSEKWRNGVATPKGAESYDFFAKRVISALNQVLDHDGLALVVAHGAVFWPIHEVTNIRLQGTLPNASAIHVFPEDLPNDGWHYRQH